MKNKLFYIMLNILDLYQVNTMRKRKGIRILYVAHLFKCRGRKPRKKSVSRLTISRQGKARLVAVAVKLNGVVCYRNVKPTKKRPKIIGGASTPPNSFRTCSERIRDCCAELR